MKKLLVLTIYSSCLMVSGCAVAPKVQYTKINQGSDVNGKMFDTFSFQESIIQVEGKKGVKDDILDPSTLIITSIPTEHDDFRLGIAHADSWGTKTNLTLSKVENTGLVKKANSDFTDDRTGTITKVGGVLVKAAAFDAGSGMQMKNLPISINPLVIMIDKSITTGAKEGVIARDGVTIDFGALPKDALPIAQLPVKAPTGLFLYAACRGALVKVQLADQTTFNKALKISDPRYFQFASFPLKGTITTHSECGVSVASEKDALVKSGFDIAEALVTQATAFKSAIDARKGEK